MFEKLKQVISIIAEEAEKERKGKGEDNLTLEEYLGFINRIIEKLKELVGKEDALLYVILAFLFLYVKEKREVYLYTTLFLASMLVDVR